MIRVLIGFVVGAAIMGAAFLLYPKTGQVTGDFELEVPYSMSPTQSQQTEFACRSLVYGGVSGDTITKAAKASMGRGTDSVALKIKDEKTLVMSTAASVEAGMAEGDDMTIVQNDNDALLAVWVNKADANSVVSTLALNKINGHAIWTKGNTNFALLGIPLGLVNYLECQ